MKLNADFSVPVIVRPREHQWVPSPVPGVSRMMLDRVGDEVARATSLVRYAPDSEFPEHAHGGGEEILVLEGAFADDHGRYPAGTYLRNPVGTRHAPSVGPEGAALLVKLHQFDPRDQRQVALDTSAPAWLPGLRPGLEIMPLHRYGTERVCLMKLAAGLELGPRHFHRGAELYVLAGALDHDGETLPSGSWLRLPPGSAFPIRAGASGVRLYLKTGHLGGELPLTPGS